MHADALKIRHPRFVGAQLAPVPPIHLGPVAALAGATAMLDVSDGLAIDAGRLARASQVGVDFDSACLGDQRELVLGGGEDHGLLATFPPGTALPAGFRRLGVVTDQAGVVLVDGRPHAQGGWDPYRGWDGAVG